MKTFLTKRENEIIDLDGSRFLLAERFKISLSTLDILIRDINLFYEKLPNIKRAGKSVIWWEKI